jgi:hypothetical protein
MVQIKLKSIMMAALGLLAVTASAQKSMFLKKSEEILQNVAVIQRKKTIFAVN